MNIFTILIIVFAISSLFSVLKSPNVRNAFKKMAANNGGDTENNSPRGFAIGKIVSTILIIGLIAIAAFNSFYTVEQNEQALIFRFGAHSSTTISPGLKFKIPFIDSVEIVNIEQVRRLEYGFRSTSEPDRNATFSDEKYSVNDSERTMITSDENLVEVEVTVQYRVIDPEAYLLNVDDPNGTLELAAYSRIRRVVASHTLDDILTLNKAAMQQEMMEDIQEIANKYELGISITAVQLQDVDPPTAVADAFTDVASAKEDKERYINEANQYANKIIPEARAEKEKLLNEAEAFKTVRINSAEGDVARFNQILEKYAENKEITRTRLYIETMREVLPNIDLYVVDDENMIMLPIDNTSINKAVAGTAAGMQ